jgi:hypothetical protein
LFGALGFIIKVHFAGKGLIPRRFRDNFLALPKGWRRWIKCERKGEGEMREGKRTEERNRMKGDYREGKKRDE